MKNCRSVISFLICLLCPSGQREWKKLYPSDQLEKSNNELAAAESRFFGSPGGGVPGRYAHSCIFFQGKIYVYGGRNDVTFFEKVECFDPGMFAIIIIISFVKDTNFVVLFCKLNRIQPLYFSYSK